MIPRVRGQQSVVHKLVRISQLLRLLARQRHQPSFYLRGDDRIASRMRSVIQCFDHAQFGRSFETSADDDPRSFDAWLARSARDREISRNRSRCASSLTSATTRRGAAMDPPRSESPTSTYQSSHQTSKSERNILILRNVCTRSTNSPTPTGSAAPGSPPVQNTILACGGLGLGTVITTNHIRCEAEVRALIGIPADLASYGLMPIGWPLEPFGAADPPVGGRNPACRPLGCGLAHVTIRRFGAKPDKKIVDRQAAIPSDRTVRGGRRPERRHRRR